MSTFHHTSNDLRSIDQLERRHLIDIFNVAQAFNDSLSQAVQSISSVIVQTVNVRFRVVLLHQDFSSSLTIHCRIDATNWNTDYLCHQVICTVNRVHQILSLIRFDDRSWLFAIVRIVQCNQRFFRLKFLVVVRKTINHLRSHQIVSFRASICTFEQCRVSNVETVLKIRSHVNDTIVVDFVVTNYFVKAHSEDRNTTDRQLNFVFDYQVTAYFVKVNSAMIVHFPIRHNWHTVFRHLPLTADVIQCIRIFIQVNVFTIETFCFSFRNKVNNCTFVSVISIQALYVWVQCDQRNVTYNFWYNFVIIE